MEMLLLLVLILTEIGFAAFAMSGKITRGEWAKRRLCVSAVELVTFLVMTLLPGIDFSFRFKGAIQQSTNKSNLMPNQERNPDIAV